MIVTRYLPRFRRAYRQIHQLAEREGWSRNQIESFQLDQLNAVWQHAIAHVSYYGNLRTTLRLPEKFRSLDEFSACVPPVDKPTVRRRAKDFLSQRAEPGDWHSTSGSTGEPLRAYWSRTAHSEMLWAKYRQHAMWNIDIFDRKMFLWGQGAAAVPGWPGRIAKLKTGTLDWLRNRRRLSAYRLGPHDLRNHLSAIRKFRPAAIYGYSRAVYLLAVEAASGDFSCDSIKLLTLTSEPALPFLVQKIESAFGAPATIEYGSIECGSLAQEWPDRTLRIREDLVYVETKPREDGRHELIVTVLNNPSFPLLRYAIGDVTDAPLTRPPHGFSILQNVVGRQDDFVVTRTGRMLHSFRFDSLFEYECEGVRRFRIRQRTDGSLNVAIELQPGHRPDLSFLQSRIQQLVEGYPVQVQVAQGIEQTAAGKHRLVTSDLMTSSPPCCAASQPCHHLPCRCTDSFASPSTSCCEG
jgi:phenylacetate-CoA ligase